MTFGQNFGQILFDVYYTLLRGKFTLPTNARSFILFGLATNCLFGWWWADPAAAIVMVPLIAREGAEGIRANACC